VRHLEDGSVNFIEGASQPSYVVTADDVDTLLAIEVQPLDDRKRKVLIVMWLIFLFRELAGEVHIFVLRRA